MNAIKPRKTQNRHFIDVQLLGLIGLNQEEMDAYQEGIDGIDGKKLTKRVW